MNTLGKRLTQLREHKGWSKTEVARRLGMKGVSTYANYEYDLREPDNETIKLLAKLFEVSTDYLLGGEDSPINKNIDPMENENKLGKLLRDLRGNLSLREVAKLTGLSHSYISDVEKGYTRTSQTPISPSIDTLQRFSEAYNYPLEKILQSAGYIKPSNNFDEIKTEVDKFLRDENVDDQEIREFLYMIFNEAPQERERLRKIMEAYLDRN